MLHWEIFGKELAISVLEHSAAVIDSPIPDSNKREEENQAEKEMDCLKVQKGYKVESLSMVGSMD